MKRSSHNLSHYRISSYDMGELVPVGCMEVLPGDTIRHSTSMLLRVTPLVSPLMHPIQLRVHHWFVPNRILWDGWEDYISKQTGTHPTITYTEGTSPYTLVDHLGVPPRGSAAETHVLNAFPIRAYNSIFNEFYRDQDIDSAVSEDSLVLQRVRWQKDNFTTARTYPQYGSTGLSIPFAAGPMDVKTAAGDEDDIGVYSTTEADHVGMYANTGGSDEVLIDGTGTAAHQTGKMYVDPTDSQGIDINDFRQAMAFQKFLENRNRYGSRYVDYLRALGVRPRDGRLSRPEYLGGGKQTIAFSEILSTNGADTSFGSLAGHGIAALRTRPYRRFFEEHGHILTLVSARPRAIYQSGKHRMWERQEGTASELQYWEKEHEALGPAPVYDWELFGDQDTGSTTIFGYNDRHHEYRKHPSSVAGGMRDGGDYEDWTLSREFAAAPTLNASFLTCTPSDRAYAATSVDELQSMANHSVKARRLVSKFARF